MANLSLWPGHFEIGARWVNIQSALTTDVNRYALRDAINTRAADSNGLKMYVDLPDAEAVFDLDEGGKKVIAEDQLLDLDRQIAQLLERRRDRHP